MQLTTTPQQSQTARRTAQLASFAAPSGAASAGAADSALPKAKHAIVVLGCAANADGTPKSALRRRLERALVELQRDPHAVVVVTGGAVWNAAPEAHVMKRWLVEHGVDAKRVVIEDKARLTIENAENVMPLLGQMGTRKLTLVTERFHMQRSRRLFDSALHASGLGKRVVVTESEAPDNLAGFARLKRSFQELKALLRDTVNQAQLHAGKPLVFVPQQVTQIDNWQAPPPGYVDWTALFARSREEAKPKNVHDEIARLREARTKPRGAQAKQLAAGHPRAKVSL